MYYSFIVFLTHFLAFAIGGAIAILITNNVTKPDGIFKINTYDPDKDVYSLEFSTPLNEIPNKKDLVFKVEIEGKPDIAK